MTKPEATMNDQARMTNKVIGHSSLVIRHLFAILVSSFVIASASAQLTIPRRANPFAPARGADSKKAPEMGAPTVVRGDEITPRQRETVEKGLIWLANH